MSGIVWAYALLGWVIALVVAVFLSHTLNLSSPGAFLVGMALGAGGAFAGVAVGTLRAAR